MNTPIETFLAREPKAAAKMEHAILDYRHARNDLLHAREDLEHAKKDCAHAMQDFDHLIHDFTHALTDWEKGGRLRLAGRGKGARGGRSERLELGQQ